MESEECLKYDDFINLYCDILLASKELILFVNFSQSVLYKKKFHPELFIKLLGHDSTKIKNDYLDVIKNIINDSEQFNNKIERNAKVASANICLAEYHKKDRAISEQYFVTANNHITNMQRAPIYARQQMYLDLVNYFKNFDEKNILEKVDQKKGEGLIFIVGMPRSGTSLV